MTDSEPGPYDVGFYVLLRAAYVAYDADNFAPDDDELIAVLEEGKEICLTHQALSARGHT